MSRNVEMITLLTTFAIFVLMLVLSRTIRLLVWNAIRHPFRTTIIVKLPGKPAYVEHPGESRFAN